MENALVEKEVKRIFKILGVKPTLKGYYYWPFAVKEAMRRGEINCRICVHIYEAVAKKFNITPSNAERCMRTVTKGFEIRIKKFFEVNLEKITNKDFLALIIEKIQERSE